MKINVKKRVISLRVEIPKYGDGKYRTEAMIHIFWNKSKKHFYFWYYEGKKQKQYSCGTTDKKQAQANAEKRMKEILAKEALEAGVLINLSISQLKEVYVARQQNRLQSTTLRIIKTCFDLLEKHIGDKKLSDLTEDDCDSFIHDGKRQARWSKTIYGHLRAAFDWAVKKKYCQINHFAKVEKPIPVNITAEWLTTEEFNRLLETMPESTFYERTQRRLLIVAFDTGTRQGELLALLQREVHFKEGLKAGFIDILCSFRHTTKPQKSRQIPLSKRAIAVIIDQMAENRFYHFENQSNVLFPRPTDGAKIPPSTISHTFKKHARIAFPDRPSIHFHSLRHSYCSRLMRNGVPPQEVMLQAGHSELKTTMGYSHMDDFDFQRSLAVLNAVSDNQ